MGARRATSPVADAEITTDGQLVTHHVGRQLDMV
jgi:hypothetical protein